MTNPKIRLGAVSLDAADAKALATFYRDLLGLEVMFESDDFVALKGASTLITTQRIDDYREPDWPGNEVPKQVHLELGADDLDAAEAFAVSVGARTTPPQEGADRFRVLLDPAGHPFCLTTLIPDD
jgi:catechol 2,3-dioxygenase-like lactoylglutathione lyase family enzyme